MVNPRGRCTHTLLSGYHPWKTKNFTRDGEEFTKVRRAVTEAKSYSHGWLIGIWQILRKNHGIIGQAFSHRLETSEIAERAVRRVKEGTSAVLLQSGLDEKWWSDSMKCYCYLQNVSNLLADGKSQCERRFWESFKGPIMLFVALIGYLLRERQSTNSTIWKKIITRNYYWLCLDRGDNLEGRHSDCWYWRIGKVGCIRNLSQKT